LPSLKLTGGKTLTFQVNDTNRTINMGGNITTAAAFTTSGAFALILTVTEATNVTFPASGTVLTSLAGQFSTFAAKSPLVAADVFLIEDSAAVGAKKSATVTALAAAISGRLLTHAQVVGTTSGPTTGSASFGLLAEMTYTFTPTAATNNIRVAFNGGFQHSSNERVIYIAIYVDGVLVPGTERPQYMGSTLRFATISVENWMTLSVAAHTITIQWRTSNATATAIGTNRFLIVDQYSA
jgi:hypothetical protein